ncbi:hypothetical protein DH2020_030507 [Rehmannia glutinosa]|uniref:Retrotransposon Copia-like N-terminal domain-containing protein n=1 Tax=Rehmannia glutinosa TaxID=99300 RepID=A0ABR0VLD2_REHGL
MAATIPNEQVIQPQSQLITVKLNESNFLVWKQQIWAAIRGYGLEGYLTGSVAAPEEYTAGKTANERTLNPSFLTWTRQDQLLASWLLSSLTESILITTVGLSTSREIWECLQTTFASQNQAKIMQYRLHLQTLKKGNLQMKEYLNKIKTCCDLLGSAGEPVSQKDHVMYVLSGLSAEYNPVVVAATARLEPCSLSELHALLLSFENRLETFENHGNIDDGSFSINLATHTPHTSNRRGGNIPAVRGRASPQFQPHNGSNRGIGRFSNFRGRGGRFGNNRPRCQICHYNNHTAERCFYRADLNFSPNIGSNYSGNQQQRGNIYQQPTLGQQNSFGNSNVNVANLSNVDGIDFHNPLDPTVAVTFLRMKNV